MSWSNDEATRFRVVRSCASANRSTSTQQILHKRVAWASMKYCRLDRKLRQTSANTPNLFRNCPNIFDGWTTKWFTQVNSLNSLCVSPKMAPFQFNSLDLPAGQFNLLRDCSGKRISNEPRANWECQPQGHCGGESCSKMCRVFRCRLHRSPKKQPITTLEVAHMRPRCAIMQSV